MVPGLRRTAYKVVGSRGSLPIHQTRELRLGPADLPLAAQSAPAVPRPTIRAWRRRGRISRTLRAACGGGLTAILDLRPRRRLAGIMVGAEGWLLW